MFKFVLCALFGVAVANPQWLMHPTYSELLSPATTTITRMASSVISDPYLMPSVGLTHLIKKRDVPMLETYALPTFARDGWVRPYAFNYYLPHSPLNYMHMIKKRSASWVAPVPYVASAPVASTYVAAPMASTVVSSSPYWSGYAGILPWIKK